MLNPSSKVIGGHNYNIIWRIGIATKEHMGSSSQIRFRNFFFNCDKIYFT